MAFTAEQLRNAEIIIGVGRSLGASSRDIQIALMTALVESNLINVHYGDRDSLGLFQQRAAWGSAAQRLDPQESAKMFFTGGHGGQRGLFDFHDRNQMSMGAAAQAVQVSAFPDRYAERTGEAAAIMKKVGSTPAYNGGPGTGSVTTTTSRTLGEIPGLSALTDGMKPQLPEAPSITEVNGIGEITADEVGLGARGFDTGASQQFSPLDPMTFDQAMTPAPQPLTDPLAELKLGGKQTTTTTTTGGLGGLGGAAIPAGEGWRKAVVAYARKLLGTPYVWGGTSPTGVDCSGLVQLAFKHAGINLPRVSYQQAGVGKRVPFSKLQPGDLVAWNNSSRNPGADHIAVYIGNGMVIEAARPGTNVQVSHIYDTGEAWGVHLSF